MSSLDSSSALATAASPPSPAARLYRHALESIFRFCRSVKDLGSIMCVNRDWQSAVLSMPPIRGIAECVQSSPSAWLEGCAHSRLSRHVAGLNGYPLALNAADLCIVAELLPQLASLRCTLTGLDPATSVALGRLKNLRDLCLRVTSGGLGVRSSKLRGWINAAIRSVAQLPQLQWLELILPMDFGFSNGVPLCFDALASPTSVLRSFTLRNSMPGRYALNEQQLADVRALYWLESVHLDRITAGQQAAGAAAAEAFAEEVALAEALDRDEAEPLWTPPPTLQWQSIQKVSSPGNFTLCINEDEAPNMLYLPNLTFLRALVSSVRLPFLHALTQLRTLELWWSTARQSEEGDGDGDGTGGDDQDLFLWELRHCTQLTDLELWSFPSLDSALLALVLPAMPGLARLHLKWLPRLTSLGFIHSTPALAESLTDLSIFRCDSCPIDELRLLGQMRGGLPSLRKLKLRLESSLPSDLFDAFTPPGFPQLTEFEL